LAKLSDVAPANFAALELVVDLLHEFGLAAAPGANWHGALVAFRGQVSFYCVNAPAHLDVNHFTLGSKKVKGVRR